MNDRTAREWKERQARIDHNLKMVAIFTTITIVCLVLVIIVNVLRFII